MMCAPRSFGTIYVVYNHSHCCTDRMRCCNQALQTCHARITYFVVLSLTTAALICKPTGTLPHGHTAAQHYMPWCDVVYLTILDGVSPSADAAYIAALTSPDLQLTWL